MQLGFVPGKGTIDDLFKLRRMQKEYPVKKLCMCFVDMEKALDRAPRKEIEWSLRKKNVPVPNLMVRAVVSL